MTDAAAAGRLLPAAHQWLARRRQDAGLRPYVVYAAAALIFALFAVVLRDDGFLTASNLLNIGRQAAPIAVMAVGMAFALAASEIDLSVGAVTALSSLVAAEAVGSYGFAAGGVAALAVGAGIGLVNGLIAVKGAHPFVPGDSGDARDRQWHRPQHEQSSVASDPQRRLPCSVRGRVGGPHLVASHLDRRGRPHRALGAAPAALGTPCAVGGR